MKRRKSIKSIMQTTPRDKYDVEKKELRYCLCGHTNTVHGDWLWTCGFIGCKCAEFRERIASEPEPEPRSAFDHVKKVMSGEIQ